MILLLSGFSLNPYFHLIIWFTLICDLIKLYVIIMSEYSLLKSALRYTLHTIKATVLSVLFDECWQMYTCLTNCLVNISTTSKGSFIIFDSFFIFPVPSNHWSVLCHYNFVFSRPSIDALFDLASFTQYNVIEIHLFWCQHQ